MGSKEAGARAVFYKADSCSYNCECQRFRFCSQLTSEASGVTFCGSQLEAIKNRFVDVFPSFWSYAVKGLRQQWIMTQVNKWLLKLRHDQVRQVGVDEDRSRLQSYVSCNGRLQSSPYDDHL
jgi:hypothetical protein